MKHGRPEFIPSKEQTAIVVQTLMNFGTAKDAAVLARIPYSTYFSTMARARERRAKGRDSSDPLVNFLEQIEAADAGSTTSVLMNIAKAAKEPKHWQAGLALLRIKDPRRYGERVRVHVDAEMEDFLDRLEKKLPEHIFEQVYEAAYSEGEVFPSDFDEESGALGEGSGDDAAS